MLFVQSSTDKPPLSCADAAVTADNRALSELGWQHLSQPLVDVRSRAGIESVEQGHNLKRSGYPEPQTPRQTTGGGVAIPTFSWGEMRFWQSVHRFCRSGVVGMSLVVGGSCCSRDSGGLRGRAVEPGHQLTVGGSCRVELVRAVCKLAALLGSVLFQLDDLPVEAVDVVGRAESGFLPGLFAEPLG